jgi:hypothetical protein
MVGGRGYTCAFLHVLCAKSVEQLLYILMLPHSFQKMPGCGVIFFKLENHETGDEATDGTPSLPVINRCSRLDEALLEDLLVAEPQIGDVG